MRVYTIMATKEAAARPLDVPKDIIHSVSQHAAWYIVNHMEKSNRPAILNIAKALSNKYKTKSLKYEEITFVFDDSKDQVKGHRFSLNMFNQSLKKQFGNPKKQSINVVVGLVVNPAPTGGMIGGEYDEKKFQLSIYLKSLAAWRDFDRIAQTVNSSIINAMLVDVERVTTHELIHAIQDLYPIDEGEPVIPKTASAQEKYYLKSDEFIPLLYNIEQMYYDHVKAMLSKFSEKEQKNPAFVRKVRTDIIKILTASGTSSILLVKNSTKPSGFFVALKKHDLVRWKKAVAILVEKDKKFKI